MLRGSFNLYFTVNVSVENLAPCKKLVRVELDAAAVDAAFDAITKDFQKQASLPGFRPGKAPRAMVVKKYDAEIKDEAKRKLIGDNYRKAIEEQKLPGGRLSRHRGSAVWPRPGFAVHRHGGDRAGFSTAGIQRSARQLETKSVTDADVERALEMLRGQHAKL